MTVLVTVSGSPFGLTARLCAGRRVIVSRSMEPSGIGATPGGVRDAVRAQRFLLPELLVATAILAAGSPAPAVQRDSVPCRRRCHLSLAAWRRRARVGLALRSDWGRTLLLGIGAGIGYQGFSLYVAEPAIARLTGKLPDVSLFAPLAGNVHFLLISLAVAWTLAAFGEEFVYRGYLLTRIARVLGIRRARARRTGSHQHSLWGRSRNIRGCRA